MKSLLVLLLGIPFFAAAQTFQLAPPQTGIGLFKSPFFTDSTVVALHFDLPGAVIRYTLDGTEPGPGAAIFKDEVVIRSTCVLTAVATHPDYRSSEPVRVQFVRMIPAFKPLEATLAHPPADQYMGWDAVTLHDHDKGHENLGNGRWLGFEGRDLDYTMVFSRKISPQKLMVSVLSAPGSWILPPRKIELWASSGKKGTFEKVASLDIPAAKQNEAGFAEKMYFLSFKPVKAKRWRVVASNAGPLPDWHPGKGKPAWLFVDEVAFQ